MSLDAIHRFGAGPRFAPELQFAAESIHSLPHSRQPPVSGAPAGLEDFGVDSFSVVAHVHAELSALVPDLGLDPACLGVPERVPQAAAAGTVKSEVITVEGSAPVLNSSDASVSTVIGNRSVANLPLNGRSFGSMIQLVPGVVLVPSNSYEQGQFSVNGQRPDANYFMVDGVSANVGPAGNGNRTGQSGAGELPATNALGGMRNMVSLD